MQEYDVTPRELVLEWIEALRSGEYAQGHSMLRNEDNGHCCLGVLTDVAMKHMTSVHQDKTWSFCEERRAYTADGCVAVPPYYLHEYIGISRHMNQLVSLNDTHGKSFQEIADHIETNILPGVQ